MNAQSLAAARQLRDLLELADCKIVLAESCTAGRIAATLGCLPGISSVLCGSFVVYRNDSKYQWLGISSSWLNDPAIGPVSPRVTEQLARAGLHRTPEADLAFAITGEIGPAAPVASDGILHCCGMYRLHPSAMTRSLRLRQPPPVDTGDIDARIRRLDEATEMALRTIIDFASICGR